MWNVSSHDDEVGGGSSSSKPLPSCTDEPNSVDDETSSADRTQTRTQTSGAYVALAGPAVPRVLLALELEPPHAVVDGEHELLVVAPPPLERSKPTKTSAD